MLNLRLFNKLQEGSTASLLLRPDVPGKVQYFFLTNSVNYSIVTSGVCDGNITDNDILSFDVSISSIRPLLDKGRQFRLSFIDSKLRFEEVNGKFYVEPLCVMHSSEYAKEIISKYLEFRVDLDRYNAASAKIEEYENKILFQDGLDETESKSYEDIKSQMADLTPVSYSEVKKITDASAKYGVTLSFCDGIAVAQIRNSYLIQKIERETMAIHAKLLQRLILESGGEFFIWREQLVFLSSIRDKQEVVSTVVFLQRYLPGITVSSSLITKGPVLEKYSFDLGSIVEFISPVLGKFDKMIFRMGTAMLDLSNDSNEHLICKFKDLHAETLELNKLMHGKSGAVVQMSDIDIPREIQYILPMFKENFTILVKKKKVIFKSGDLYAVFGR